MKPKIPALLMFASCLAVAAHAADKNLFENKSPVVDWLAYSSGPAQEALASAMALDETVARQSILAKPGSALGFAEKSPEARFFLMGSLTAEALALVRTGQYEEAGSRLSSLAAVAKKLDVPAGLDHYVSRVRQLIASEPRNRTALVEMLALLQPLLDDYAGSQSEDKRFLYQTGAWLADLSLASASGNYVLLKQPIRLDQTLERMRRLDAPKGTLDALGEIGEIAKQKEIGERDGKRVQRLVRKLQDMLG